MLWKQYLRLVFLRDVHQPYNSLHYNIIMNCYCRSTLQENKYSLYFQSPFIKQSIVSIEQKYKD